MKLSEVISSGLLESYILGTTTDEENAMVLELCEKHIELIQEIEAIEKSLMQASAQSSQPLDPALKQKIMSGLSFEAAAPPSSPEKIIPLQKPEQESRLKIYRFAIAASLLLFVTSFIYNILLQKQLSRVSGELAQLDASKSVMAEQLNVQQASLNSINNQFHIVANPKVKTIALNGMNSLSNNSAAVHWNTETNEVYFDALQLPASPADKQYQLWAIVGGKPVDVGVIDLANAKEVFQKMRSVQGAQAFAVTIEKTGGSVAPSLETMCLLGNV